MDGMEDARHEPEFPPSIQGTWWVANILLVIGSIYFLFCEWEQLISSGWRDYCCDKWNLLDLLPPIMILVIIALDVHEIYFLDSGEHERNTKCRISMQSIASFGMWLKMFYFLRLPE